ILSGDKLIPADWNTAIAHAAAQLKHFTGWEIAIIASGRMTNEELWLTRRLATILGTDLIDIVPRTGPSDDILLSADRNPNTNGARLLRVASQSGTMLQQIREAIWSGQVQALISLGENPFACGIAPEQLARLPVYVSMDIL